MISCMLLSLSWKGMHWISWVKASFFRVEFLPGHTDWLSYLTWSIYYLFVFCFETLSVGAACLPCHGWLLMQVCNCLHVPAECQILLVTSWGFMGLLSFMFREHRSTRRSISILCQAWWWVGSSLILASSQNSQIGSWMWSKNGFQRNDCVISVRTLVLARHPLGLRGVPWHPVSCWLPHVP